MDDLPALWRLGISTSGDALAFVLRAFEASADLLYREADARLYAAKAERGRVVA